MFTPCLHFRHINGSSML